MVSSPYFLQDWIDNKAVKYQVRFARSGNAVRIHFESLEI